MQTASSQPVSRAAAFTLVELLVVITIIIILAGLLFPAFGAVQERAKKVQASNDEQAIINAVKNYFTEYGRYPVPASTPPAGGVATDLVYGPQSTADYTNERLINVLRGLATTEDGTNTGSDYKLNARQIVFLEAKNVKDKNAPKNGISIEANASGPIGQWMDPWGKPYVIFVDADYNNHISPTTFKKIYAACTDNEDGAGNIAPNAGATAPTPRVGVAVSSFGKDLAAGVKTSGSENAPVGNGDYSKSGCDDVVSWR